jgi:hypothetical protein
MPSYEQAQRCLKCDEHGELGSTHPVEGRPGTKVESWYCRNAACTWFNTAWLIQVNPDGTIPEYKTGPKQYPAMSPDVLARGQRVTEDAVQRDLRDERDPDANQG